MKKLLLMAMLMFSLLGSANANAMAVTDAGSYALQGLNNTLQAAGNVLQEAWKVLEEGWNKARQEFEEQAWVKQLKGMWDQISEMKKTVAELMGLRDDVMNTLSGARNLQLANFPKSGPSSIDYKYTAKLPEQHITAGSCSDTGCTYSSDYNGPASAASSNDIRESWRVTGNLTQANVNTLSYQAAEEYAQQIAVIQAMAQEAYTQANNRIAKIEELQQKINGATDAVNKKSIAPTDGQSGMELPTYATGTTSPNSINGTQGTAGDNSASTDQNKNDLKYIADLQARIQAEQALLINDQNKLTSLAILQQSAKDAYEQRKKEIAAYAVRGGDDGRFNIGGIVTRGLVGAAQTAAYGAVVAAYQ